MLRASCFLYVLHGSSLALTFYSPFCWGDTLIYMDLCEPKSFEFLKTWRYMDIYEDTLPMGAPSIPNFIVFSISLKSLDFQGLPESGVFGLRHFYAIFAWTYMLGNPAWFKLPHSLIQGFRCDMNVSVHRCFYTCVTKQLLQHLGLYAAFNRSCGVGMA